MLNTTKMVNSLAEKGWFFQSNVFDEKFVNDAVSTFSNQSLKSAGIGSQAIRHSEIRNDSIFWLEKEQTEFSDSYLQFFESIKNTLNENLYLGIKSHEVHYAKYPQGGFYKPHLDNFQGKNKRVVTVITYLNQNWHPQDGGVLKLHLPEGIKEIQPKAGSMIAFISEQILHEVAPSFKERHSLTGWLLNT